MSTTLLPQAFWFRLALPCRKVSGIPRKAKGLLLDLPVGCQLAETNSLNGQTSRAEVRAGWSAEGLALQVLAEGSLDALGAVDRPEGFCGVRFWVDTRDTRNVSRATRYCHRFEARLSKRSGKSSLAVVVEQLPIARAVADAPICDPGSIQARVEMGKASWCLELFLSADALSGYDPETNRRLGFAYQVTDLEHEDQFLGVGREFPVGENPSLWSTLELLDDH